MIHFGDTLPVVCNFCYGIAQEDGFCDMSRKKGRQPLSNFSPIYCIMSKINIQGTVDNIKSKSNVYTPLVEAIVNSIDSITASEKPVGEINVVLIRDQTLALDDSLPAIRSIEIHDNGMGFTQDNRDSFDTLYSLSKKQEGGKGFGRFMFLKYFADVRIESTYQDKDKTFRTRKFRFGRKYEIITEETNEAATSNKSHAVVYLSNLYPDKTLDKEIETIARKLLERLLIFFINDKFVCPKIIITEKNDSQKKIILNDYLSAYNEIQLIHNESFDLEDKLTKKTQSFTAKVFRIYFSKAGSKIILTAHNREVTETSLHLYVPEFEDEFFEEFHKVDKIIRKNYVVKTYILSEYLDANVSLERESFNFDKDKPDPYYPFPQTQIEREAAYVTKNVFDTDVNLRAQKKHKRIHDYVSSLAPWHKMYIQHVDLSPFPFNATDERIELELQKYKFQREQETRAEINHLLLTTGDEEFSERLNQIVSKVTEIGKSDLAHYVSNRKVVLQIFEELRKRTDEGHASLEKEIHSLIYPMNRDSTNTSYEDHNLWLLDERLVFSEYIASDRKISNKPDALDEPDLLIFDIKKTYRSGENEFSNPLTIFEFKRPKRTAYKQEDDPILQIGNYLAKIKDGKYEMPEGIEPIKVNNNTPVYAYIVADLMPRIHDFARIHQLTISPDQEGYFGFHTGFNMYIEIMSFTKVFKDSMLRNKVFFKRLQIE